MVKDGFKQRYPYDVNRSIATFEQAGWRRGANGVLMFKAVQPPRLNCCCYTFDLRGERFDDDVFQG